MILIPLLIVCVGLIILGARDRAAAGRTGWCWFAAWAVAGFALAFAVVGIMSIGFVVLPFAIVIMIWVARRSPNPSEALGLFTGVGATLLLIAFINRDYTPCTGDGLSVILPTEGTVASVSCGGLDPSSWLRAGLILTALAVSGYAILRRRVPRPPKGTLEAVARTPYD